MWKLLYGIIAIAGFIIRQYFLPNPFAPIGVYGELINLAASGVIGLLAYIIVGLFYEKGSIPFLGSLMYLVVYSILTFELWLAFKLYPHNWLIGIAMGIMLFADGFVIKKLRDAVV